MWTKVKMVALCIVSVVHDVVRPSTGIVVISSSDSQVIHAIIHRCMLER